LGKQGPELLDRRFRLYSEEQRMVFGANTFRVYARMFGSSTEGSALGDPWVTRMRRLPLTVVSSTLEGPLDWPDATVASGDAVDVVARVKKESEVSLHSHGSLSMNRALMAAGLVDRIQVTLFPVITGQTGSEPSFWVQPTSTSSWSRAGRSTAASKSSTTSPPCMSNPTRQAAEPDRKLR
jgi:dihydrofolate reductase